MKTVEELYKDIVASKELQEELKTVSYETLGDFLAKHGCEATAQEFVAFVRAQSEGPIDDDAAAAIAAGTGPIIDSWYPKTVGVMNII